MKKGIERAKEALMKDDKKVKLLEDKDKESKEKEVDKLSD